MVLVVSISCILPTARGDYPIIGMSDMHVLAPTFMSLEAQTFKDFEVIVVDALHPYKKEWIESHDWSFPIKYVPIHPNHRFWLDRKRWNVCGQLNTGILHAEGELLVRIDDCSEFPNVRYLERFWEDYQSGFFPMAMHTRYRDGKQSYYTKEYKRDGYEFTRDPAHGEAADREKVLDQVFEDGDPVRDTRWPFVEKAGGRMIVPYANWYYGYSSVSLEAALRVNGYDEMFDGDKSLEDVDMGSRLIMAGYKDMFVLDTDLWAIEHEHGPISIISGDVKPIKCNYAIYLLHRKLKRWRVNQHRLTDEDLVFIREESLKPPCSPRPDFYEDDCQGEMFDLWASNPSIFDLREERLML